MGNKRPELIIEPSDFHVFLKARMAGRSVKAFADQLGVYPTLLYMLLSGERSPSPAMLEKLGLDVVYRAKAPVEDEVVERKPSAKAKK